MTKWDDATEAAKVVREAITDAKIAEAQRLYELTTSGWYVDKYTIGGVLYRVYDKYRSLQSDKRQRTC